MNTIEINIQEPYFSFIRDGVKTVEGRINKGRFAQIREGDTLIVKGIAKQFKVLYKKPYKTFLEMIEKEGVKNVIPDKESVQDGANVYFKFFTKKQEKEFGVVAIKIEEMKS